MDKKILTKGEFQICPRMDFDNILYVEYIRYNNYKNEIILFLTLLGHRGTPWSTPFLYLYITY